MRINNTEHVKHASQLLENSKTFTQIQEDLGLQKSGCSLVCGDHLVMEVK